MGVGITERDVRYFTVFNADEEDAPPYALLFSDTDAASWQYDGDTIVPVVRRTTASGAGQTHCPGKHMWFIAGPMGVKADGFGQATIDLPYKVLLDDDISDPLLSIISDYTLGPKQGSWGVVGSPAVKLFTGVNSDVNDEQLMWVVLYTDLKPPKFQVLVDGVAVVTGTSSGDIGSLTCEEDGFYLVNADTSCSISKFDTTCTLQLTHDDTKFEDQPFPDFATTSRSTPKFSITPPPYTSGEFTINLDHPGFENMALSSYIILAKDDKVTLKAQASQSATLAFIHTKILMVKLGPPFFTPTGLGA